MVTQNKPVAGLGVGGQGTSPPFSRHVPGQFDEPTAILAPGARLRDDHELQVRLARVVKSRSSPDGWLYMPL